MEQKISSFLQSAHPSSAIGEIAACPDLFSAGFLDSLLLLHLLSFLEKETGARIPPLRVSRKAFLTVESITRLVESVKNGG